MGIMHTLNEFLNDESGAVTVDWVALTAGVLIIGALIGKTVMDGASAVGTAISAELVDLSTAVSGMGSWQQFRALIGKTVMDGAAEVGTAIADELTELSVAPGHTGIAAQFE